MSLRGTLVVAVLLLGLAITPRATLAQTNIQTRSIGDLTAAYDALEAELLRRVKIQISDRDPELGKTALALAHIGSKKAIPLFFLTKKSRLQILASYTVCAARQEPSQKVRALGDSSTPCSG